MKPLTAKEALNQIAYVLAAGFIIRFILNLPDWIALLLGAMLVYVALYQLPKREQRKNKKNEK